jgi:phage shock protein PspC (stress-responsive transcriptional regulator)
MNRTIAIILLIAVGIYCFPGILAAIAAAFGLAVGLAATLLGVGLSVFFTVLPYLVLAYVVWWLVRDNRRQRQH